MAFAFKPIQLIPENTKIPFSSYFRGCLALSGALFIATAVLLGAVGLNFGIDFRGGTLIEIQTKDGPADLSAIRSNMGGLGLGEVQIQTFGGPDEILIRVAEQPGGEQAQQEAVSKIQSALGDNVEIRRTEVVGATVSGELVEQALIALVLTCLGIFVYVWLRFEWQFALGAVVALFHDVFITVGVFSATQMDFDVTIVAALLTILGYSINDTVVIYDRIRENLRKFKKMPLRSLIDLSLNETLARTVMTTGTTLLALMALYIFGGEVIRGFTFGILFGILIGTYSSVFIAAPVLEILGVKRDWSGVKAPSPGSERRTADV
jgi:preprotein translocase SecF subunit